MSVPIIAVLGHKNSGKTTVIRVLCSYLRSKGLKVLAAKHIAHKEFTIDTPGKDTYVLRGCCGSVLYYADSKELGIILNNVDRNSVIDIIKVAARLLDVDIVLIEGFSKTVMGIPEIAKVICIKDPNDIKQLLSEQDVKGPVLACSISGKVAENVVSIPEDVDLLFRYVDGYLRIFNIYKKLGGLNCGRCGYRRCVDLAHSINLGKDSPTRCVFYNTRGIKLTVGSVEIPLNRFVANLLRNLVVAFVRSLKDVPEQLDNITIEVRLRE